MKIFLDTIDCKEIEKWIPTGLIDGITTNPTLLSKSNVSDIKQAILTISKMLPDGDISVEVVQEKPEDVYREALDIAQMSDNIVVKIPFHKQYLPIINKLTNQGIDLNITLVFSALQALMVANLGVTYISPFVARTEDSGSGGIELIEDIVDIIDTYDLESEVLAASIRTVDHWKKVALAGADVVTLAPTIFEKAMYHPLTEKGLEDFKLDWAKTGKKTLFQ